MAKKKRAAEKKTMPQTVSEPSTRPVRLDLNPDVHRLLRKVAADADVSMAAFARDLVEKHVREEAKRRGVS